MATTFVTSDAIGGFYGIGSIGSAVVTVPTDNDVFITSDVLVYGSTSGVDLDDQEQVLTSMGHIMGDFSGISMSADGTKAFEKVVKIGATGTVFGASSGVFLGAASGQPDLLDIGSATLENAGAISGGFSGVTFSRMNLGNVINTGTISSTDPNGGTAITFGSIKVAILNNSGTISNADLGNNGTGTNASPAIYANSFVQKLILINSGTISSPHSALLSQAGIEDITNTGTIIGDLELSNKTTGLYEFDNFGTIVGDVDSGSGDDNFYNTGTVQGDLDLGDDDDLYHASAAGIVTGTITGGDGNDTITAANSDDVIDAGDDNDVVNAGGGADLVSGGTGNDVINGGEGDDTLSGGNDQDIIRGGGGSDEIDGGAGHDGVLGGIGDDTLIGGEGNDTLRGGSGADLLQGGNDNDNVAGGGGDDTVNGGDGEDKLYGGNGDDEIFAGGGKDVMRGNAGADTFIFLAVSDSGVSATDRIRDFQSGTDLIDISAITGFTFVSDAAFSGTQAEVRYQTTNSGLLIEMDIDGDGIADMRVNMNGVSDLVATDFIL